MPCLPTSSRRTDRETQAETRIPLKNPPRRTLSLVGLPGRDGDLRTVHSALCTLLYEIG
jgi:hypothetical protein